MLISEPRVHIESGDPIFAILASVEGRQSGAKEIATGVYEVSHYGSSHFLRDGYVDSFHLELTVSAYGVCDDYQQILDQCPELHDPNRKFVITLTRVRKDEQSSDGGWRWHKWGPYVGKHEPTMEYLYDEPNIEQVFVYHIYEKQPSASR